MEKRPETPLSITTPNNAVFEVTEDITTIPVEYEDILEHVTIPEGTLLSLLDCNLGDAESPFRYDGLTVIINNRYVKHVWGNIGQKVKTVQEDLYVRIKELEDELQRLQNMLIQTHINADI